MSTHTEAPWTLLDSDSVDKPSRLISENGMPIATLYAPQKSDARLISAAPELLDACRCALADLEGIVDELPGDHPAYLTIQELRAAITKATEESQ